MTISNEPERHEQLRRLLDEQRAALSRYTGAAKITLTAEGARRLAAHTGETLGQVEQAARRQGMNVERQTEIPRAEVDYAAGDRTLFPADPSTEYMLPELADDEDFHVVARVGDIEMREEWRAGEWLRVRDERSGLWVEIRCAADCGAECECGGEVRLVEQPGEEREALDDDAPEGTPTHWQPCANGDGRRTMHASGLCSACRQQLDATMRDQMAQWPDDTLALLTVGELRGVLRRAVEAGATVADDDNVIVEQLVRDLPISDEERAAHGLLSPVDVRDVSALKADPTLTGDEVRAVAFGELPATRAACGCLRIEGEIRHIPACPVPNVGRPESFERPGSAYEGALGRDGRRSWLAPEPPERLTLTVDHVDQLAGTLRISPDQVRRAAVRAGWRVQLPEGALSDVAGYDPNTHAAITDPRIVAIIEQLRYAAVNGVGFSLDAEHAAALGQYLGWTR